MLEEESLPEGSPAPDNRRSGVWWPQPPLVLALSVILSIPTIYHLINGSTDPNTALFDYLLALVVAWFALIIVGNVIAHYVRPMIEAEEQRRRDIEEAALSDADDLDNLRNYATGGEVEDTTRPSSAEDDDESLE